MLRLGFVLVALAALLGACGNSAGDAATETIEPDRLRNLLQSTLKSALLNEIPLLIESEASCIADAILTEMPDTSVALEDSQLYAAEVVAATRGAQEKCLTAERITALEEAGALPTALEPFEEAFLFAARDVGGGLFGSDLDIVGAGYLMCSLANEAGSLSILLQRLAATPASSARTAADLSPLIGQVLQVEDLMTFGTVAVGGLCPELNGG